MQINNDIYLYLTILFCVLSLISPLLGIFSKRWKNQQNIFIPAGFTFIIWLPIYIGLIIYCGYQIGIPVKERDIPDNVDIYLFISVVLNFIWLLAATFDSTRAFTVPILVLMYLFTFKVYYLVEPELNVFSTGVSLYFAWLNIALLANIMSSLEEFKVFSLSTLNYIGVGFIILSIFLGIFLVPIIREELSFDYIFTLVFIWALIGIYAKRSSISTVKNDSRRYQLN